LAISPGLRKIRKTKAYVFMLSILCPLGPGQSHKRTNQGSWGYASKVGNGDINRHAARDFKKSRQLYSVAILK